MTIASGLQDPAFTDKLDGTVECDETFIGGKGKGKGDHFMGNKTPVVSLLERGGRVRSQVVRHVPGNNLKKVLRNHINLSATIMTDDFVGYRKATQGFASH